MRKKIIRYFAVFFLLLLVGSMTTAKPCLAASAQIQISADDMEVTLGDSLFIYITITSETSIGDFEANLTYDDDTLEYQRGASVITGSSGFLKIADIDVSEGTSSRKYMLKFKALKVGVCKITFNSPIKVYEYETMDEMSVASNDFNVNVKAADTASTNTFLQSLKISPSELTPTFDKNIFEYNSNVGNETEKLVINALPENNKSVVSISGNDLLKVGENKIIITVLAESGADIQYNINVVREKAPNEATPDELTITPGATQSTIKVVKIDGEIFAIYEGKYKLVEPDNEVKIPDGYTSAKIIISDISINAYSLLEDPSNDFLLIYAMNELGEAGFYKYDRIEKTMQRYVPDEAYGFNNVVNSQEKLIMNSEEYHANLNKAALIIAILSIICILLIAGIIHFYMKSRGYKEDDLK